jgi:hypothetical protein
MTVHHTFVSSKSDGSDATLVQPSAWNAAHTIDAATITKAMIENVSAQGMALGRLSAGAGSIEEIPILGLTLALSAGYAMP